MKTLTDNLNESLYANASKVLKEQKGRYEICVILPYPVDTDLEKELDAAAETVGSPIDEGRIWFLKKGSKIKL